MTQVIQLKNIKSDPSEDALVSFLCVQICSWYVRRDEKFYDVDRLGTRLSRTDVERGCINRISEMFPDWPVNDDVLKKVFNRAITSRHSTREETIAVWNGSVVCKPGAPRLVWVNGAVAVNSWRLPEYRQQGVTNADFGVASDFFAALFPHPTKAMVVNWLAWCLQNEADKPGWSLFLYSRRKGTGKSTFCSLVSKLFGEANSVSQNNVNKLTAQFNTTVLNSKLVVSEELQLKQDSPQSNSLKTYITEKTILAERKGVEAEQIEQRCCFLFTTNHLPTWIEADDRRYYVVEVDHDGHAAGPEADSFSDLVGRVHGLMNDPTQVAALYNALMAHPVPDTFNAHSLNISRDSTEVMERIQSASSQITTDQLEEFLNKLGQFAVPEATIGDHVREKMHRNINAVRHIMTDLGWSKKMAQWGGVDYARAIWIHPGYTVDGGYVHGPDGYKKKIEDKEENSVGEIF